MKPIEKDFEEDKEQDAVKKCIHGNTLPPWGLPCRECALERSEEPSVIYRPSTPPVPIKKADVEESFLYAVAVLMSIEITSPLRTALKVDVSGLSPYYIPVYEKYEEALLEAKGNKDLVMKIGRRK